MRGIQMGERCDSKGGRTRPLEDHEYSIGEFSAGSSMKRENQTPSLLDLLGVTCRKNHQNARNQATNSPRQFKVMLTSD